MHRILVIRAGAIGDFILTLPVLTTLRQAFPGVQLDVMGNPSIARLALNGQAVDTILSIDRADLAPFFIQDTSLPSSLASLLGHYDAIVSYIPDRDGVFAANLARATTSHVLTGFPVPLDGDRTHMTHQLLRPVVPLGTGAYATAPLLLLSTDDHHRAEAFLTEHSVPQSAHGLVAVHPGSGGRRKCWPAERYAALFDALAAAGLATLLSAGEADSVILGEVRAHLRRATPIIADQLDLPLLAAVLSRCRLMIGNDSGITHLAAAVGTPTIALFGPTDPAIWGPRGQQVKIVWGEEIFRGDVGATGEIPLPPQFPSLTTITVDRVIRTVDGMMAENFM